MGQIFSGTSGWAYKSWSPDFYPKSVKAGDYLSYYSSQLNAVEVNYTFRRRLTEQVQEKWIAATPQGFMFSIKAPQAITHFKRLKDCGPLLKAFLESLQPLASAKRLGPLLFQLPPNLKADAELLRDFLSQMPKAARASLEFRHPSWFTDLIFNLLRESNVALCIAETEDSTTPDIVTADYYYTRLRKPDYSSRELDNVSTRIQDLARRGDIFAFFKHEETAEGALNAMKLLQKLHRKAA